MRELSAEKVRDMTEDEIETKIRELHEEIFNLRFRNAMRQLQNPVLIRERRRDIARMRTILAEHRQGIRPLAGHGAGHQASGAPKAAPAAATATAVKAEKKAGKAKPAKAAKATKATKATKAKSAAKKKEPK